MKTKEELKEIILNQFRKTNSKAGHVVLLKVYDNTIMKILNPEEQKLFVDAANELITEGVLIFDEEGPLGRKLQLTEYGYSILYKAREDYEIAELIMSQFRQGNYRSGQVILMRHFSQVLIPSLNPVEQERFFDVATRLINECFIIYDDGKSGRTECIELTDKGYDYIYKQNISVLRSIFS